MVGFDAFRKKRLKRKSGKSHDYGKAEVLCHADKNSCFEKTLLTSAIVDLSRSHMGFRFLACFSGMTYSVGFHSYSYVYPGSICYSFAARLFINFDRWMIICSHKIGLLLLRFLEIRLLQPKLLVLHIVCFILLGGCRLHL